MKFPCLYVLGLLLDVKGCRDVYASLDKYVSTEHLEGDNKYCTEQHGLQVLWKLHTLMNVKVLTVS